MKAMNYSLLRTICAFVIGLVLVMWPNDAVRYLVITIGVMFLIPGIISVIGYFFLRSDEGEKHRFPVEGIGSFLFGLWLVMMPDFFTNILMFILGFILIMGGVHQIASLARARRWVRVPMAFYVVPSLVLLAGIVVLFNPTGAIRTTFLIIGITSMVYAVSELVNWIKFLRRRPKDTTGQNVDIEDAKIIE